MDKRLVMEIITAAFDAVTNGRVEKIGDTPPDRKLMTSETFQTLKITKESLIKAFLKDPRVISVEYKDGKFHIKTLEGTITFNFKFEDEKTSGSA